MISYNSTQPATDGLISKPNDPKTNNNNNPFFTFRRNTWRKSLEGCSPEKGGVMYKSMHD
jgi:hypothetical protein